MYRSLVMEERNIGFAASLHIETNWEDIFHPTHPLLIHWKLVSFWSPGPWCSRHWATRLRCCHEVQDSYAVCFEWQLWPVALPFLLWKLFEHVVGPSKKRSCRGFKKQPESMHDLNQNLSVLPASCDFYRFLMIFVGILNPGYRPGKISVELQRRSPVLARRDDWKVGQPSVRPPVTSGDQGGWCLGPAWSSSKFPILKVIWQEQKFHRIINDHCQSMSIYVKLYPNYVNILITLKWVHGCDQARTPGGFLNHSSSGGFVHMALGPRICSSTPRSHKDHVDGVWSIVDVIPFGR